ncbi:MAG: hypothetical protein AVDCRST_MAG38-1254, partial [uncultured Solirubrobacteraceae bacterium]
VPSFPPALARHRRNMPVPAAAPRRAARTACAVRRRARSRPADGPAANRRPVRQPCRRRRPAPRPHRDGALRAAQRSEGDPGGGPLRAGRHRRRVVRRGRAQRAPGSHGLRPPVRAHDVPGLGQREEGRALPAGRAGRRQHERQHRRRPHQLLPDAPLQPPEPRAVAGVGPHAVALRHGREPEEPAGGGEGGAPAALRQPAVHRHGAALAGRGVRPEDVLRIRARAHRLDGRPERGAGGGRQGLLQAVLRAEQRDARRHGRLRSGRGEAPRAAVLRRHRARGRAAAGAVRAAVQPRRAASQGDRREGHAAGLVHDLAHPAGEPPRHAGTRVPGDDPRPGRELAPQPRARARGQGGARAADLPQPDRRHARSRHVRRARDREPGRGGRLARPAARQGGRTHRRRGRERVRAGEGEERLPRAGDR